jgi:hypothetical protein
MREERVVDRKKRRPDVKKVNKLSEFQVDDGPRTRDKGKVGARERLRQTARTSFGGLECSLWQLVAATGKLRASRKTKWIAGPCPSSRTSLLLPIAL